MKGIDAQLINRCIKSDEAALYTLYRESYSLMKGIALRYVFDQSEIPDVINRGFVKIVKGLPSYDTSQAFGPWAATIVINESLDYVRRVMRQKPKQLHLQEELSYQMKDCHDLNLADQEYDASYLLDLLNLLPNRTKVVFNLFAIDGYSHEEIAQKLNISTGTTKWHVSKAREKLQKELANWQVQTKLISE